MPVQGSYWRLVRTTELLAGITFGCLLLEMEEGFGVGVWPQVLPLYTPSELNMEQSQGFNAEMCVSSIVRC